MAIPDNYIDKITKGNDSRMISPAADMVRVNNDNFNGADLDEVLDDVAQAISEAGEVKSVSVNNGTPSQPDAQGNVNLTVATGGETVVINSDGANIVDEHDNNSVLLAPSARQMKLMYNNIMAIYNGLANIAFTNVKPTLDWVGAKTKYTLAYGTLNGCTADVAAGQVNEGALRIKLTPTQVSYAFTSVTVNGQSAQTTATGDTDGSVYLDIVVNGNITVAATAISGRAVNFNGTGCSIGAAGVATGHDLDTTITANEHFTLPASITVKIGNANVTHTYTRAQDNKTATLHIDAANITGDLTITCTAVEEAHTVLNLSNVGSGVTVNKANNAHVYVGDTITIMPASGNKVDSASATVGGNAVTLNGNAYGGYIYTIGSSDVSSGGTTIAITATASALQTFSIDMSGVTSDVGVTWNTPSAAVSTILEGSPFSVTLEKVSGTGVLNVSTSTMGSETLTPNNGTIDTDHVAGDITISASVAAAPMKVHSYNSKDVDADNKNYMVDSVGEFPLYLQADAGYSTNNYPSGYYANGINDGYRIGYGPNRTLNIEQGGDFTVVIKDIVMAVNASNVGYNSNQFSVRFHDRYTINVGVGTSNIGQFQLSMSTKDDAGTGFGSNMYPFIAYRTSSENVTKIFKDDGAVGSIPGARSKISGTDTYTNTYHIAVSYNASTKIATAYVIDIDNVNNNVSVKLSGSLTIDSGLIMPCIATKEYLDVFNYAMSQQDLESEYSVN